MKLSNLSIAMLMALGVIACGGSNSGNDQTAADDTPAPSPDTAVTPEEPSVPDSTLVDPTQTHVVDNRDLLKESTVGALQYIRREGSEYDRIANAEKPASSTPLLGVPLDVQNPKLTNIILARQELPRVAGVPVEAQFAGGFSPEPLTREGRPQAQRSLQVENFQNVDILAGAFKQHGHADKTFDGTPIPHDSTVDLKNEYDYDGHIHDNLKTDGEHNRTRVSHVYTLRYEYKQPFVDYPNAVDPANNRLEWPDGDGKTPETRAPVAPRHDSLTWMESNLKGSATWITTDANIHSRHPVNTGLGAGRITDQAFANREHPYANLVGADAGNQGDAAGWAYANRWRNVGFNPNDPTQFMPAPDLIDGAYRANNRGDYWISNDAIGSNTRNQKWLVDWSRNNAYGNINRGGSCHSIAGECAIGPNNQTFWSNYNYDTIYLNGWPGGIYPTYNDTDATYSYRTIYPYGMRAAISGYPHSRMPYNEGRNNTLADGVTPAGNPHNHEHLYLEQEEFSAIRTWEPVRPLKNPIPNEWKWDLYQTWHTTYPLKVEHWEVIGHTPGPGSTPIYGWVDRSAVGQYRTMLNQLAGDVVSGTGEIYHAQNLAGRFAGTNYSGTTSGITCDGATYRCTVDYTKGAANVTLATSQWRNPQNQGGGETGEFRGPAYVGWDSTDRTIRYNDRRIWDSTATAEGYKPEYERTYGANLIWWSTQDSAFENYATAHGINPRARRVDVNTSAHPTAEDLLWAQGTNNGTNARDKDIEIQPSGDITNGLIRIGGKLPTLGEEIKYNDPNNVASKGGYWWANPYDPTKPANAWYDHHNTISRIFGRYHLAFADQATGENKQVRLNSYQNARSFVSRVKETLEQNGKPAHTQPIDGTGASQELHADLTSAPEKYSIGANPMTLQKVQYGRVTTNLDLDSGEGPYDGGFLRSPFAYKNDATAVDNYFYRGIEATSVEQMKAVTANNGMARYEGHALMYGIDNNYLGMKTITETQSGNANLPNAFALAQTQGAGDTSGFKELEEGEGSLGLGNFVQADVNFATNKVSGQVYNAWLLDQDKSTLTKDFKVHFTGDIMGNTVIGTADRVYAAGDDRADFRASFFGSGAEEMGGAFNSVTRTQQYGSAYQQGDWGGVFGAKMVGSGNTFQGDDGSNVYSASP